MTGADITDSKRPGVEKAGRKPPVQSSEEMVDEALRESFPASDPPPWTLGTDNRKYRPKTDLSRKHQQDCKEMISP